MSVSPVCKVLRQRSRAGRFVVAPDMPSSLKMGLLHPARRKAASCKSCILVFGRYAGVTVFHSLILQ